MNTEVQNVGASQEAVVAQDTNDISFTEKAKDMACKAWESVKEFSQEIWEDEEGRKLLKDIGIALGVRLAFRHPLTAGIALGVIGHRAWQEIKNSLAASNNH